MLGSDPSGGGFGADFFTFLVAGVLEVVEDFVEGARLSATLPSRKAAREKGSPRDILRDSRRETC